MNLGQGEKELSGVAVSEGEQATIVVTGEIQTAIVETGARILLEFNGFFRNASSQIFIGVPLENISITLSLQRLNRSGMPIPGEMVILLPTMGTGNRVNVFVDRESEQYFVSIAGVTNFDSGVYTMELCHHRGLAEETCVNASSTLFVLDDCECQLPFKMANFLSLLYLSSLTSVSFHH